MKADELPAANIHTTAMKTKCLRTLPLGLATLGTLLLASCQAPTSTPTSALTCDKCTTIYFKAPTRSGPGGKEGLVTLRRAGTMSCPDCDNVAASWIKGGSLLKHTCKSCGGTLHHCLRH